MTQTNATQATEMAPDKTSIRPFQVSFPDAELADLRRRINATRWPEKETVTDSTQGVQLATIQKLAQLLGNRLRLAQGRSEAEFLSAVHHRDRWPRHPFHPRPFET